METIISFRKMEESDLKLLHQWLNKDIVIEWYTKEPVTYEKVLEKYLPRVKGEKFVQCYFMLYNLKPIGYIQTYKIWDFPEYNKFVKADEGTHGIDLFIGEGDYLHKGIGATIISTFLKDIVFKNNKINKCIIGPDPNNKVAIRAYEKAGFKYIKTINTGDEIEYLMINYKNN